MSTLKVNVLKKAYASSLPGQEDQPAVIENLSFKQTNNQFICLLGPSGCGKSSLLNMIAGLDTDYLGDIDITGDPELLPCSFVFQNPRLLPWQTVFENIQLALKQNSHSSEHIQSLLEQLGLAEFANYYPSQLSLGMARRVSLARAFAAPSNLLLLDEPFVSLDQAHAKTARTLLLEVWKKQASNIIFVTHDLSEAIELADRILFLSASPSTIVADISLSLPREERTAEMINRFKTELVERNIPSLSHT